MELKLPDDITDLERRGCMAIRTYYQVRLSLYHMMRMPDRPPYISGLYDQPVNNYAVWYDLLLIAARSGYNPLWAVNRLLNRAMVENLPPNAFSLLSRETAPMVVSHGADLYADGLVKLQNSIANLTSMIPTHQMMYGMTVESAVDFLSSQMNPDPVAELYWRDARRIPAKKELWLAARLAYACCPALYSHPSFSEIWREKRKLQRLFEVTHEPVVTAPAVDGLLVDSGRAMEGLR